MDTLDAVVLGIVQGITEFLPVSSSGHLQIAKELLGVRLEENITFDITLHAATVLSTIVVLWSEIRRLLCGVFTRKFNEEKAYVLKILISMVPAAVVGVLFADRLETMFSSLTFVGVMLLLTAALLAFTHYTHTRTKNTISCRDAFIIGVAQAAATMPGLSRSGSTIATGLLLGNSKESAAQFSFIMVIPVILGKMLLDIASGQTAAIGTLPLVAGFVTAFVVGALACKFMIGIVKRGKLIWFAAYCAVAGAVAIVAKFL